MGSSRKQEVERLVRQASSEGWSVDVDGNGHYAFYPPDGAAPVRVPKTPGRGRSIQNSRQELRRAGLKIPHRGGHTPVAFRVPRPQREVVVPAAEPVDREKMRPRYAVPPGRLQACYEAVATAPHPQTSRQIANELMLKQGTTDNALKMLLAEGKLFRRQQTDDERGPKMGRANLYWHEEEIPAVPRPEPVARPEPPPVAVPVVTAPVPSSEALSASEDMRPAPATPAREQPAKSSLIGFEIESVILRDGEGDLWVARRMVDATSNGTGTAHAASRSTGQSAAHAG